LQKASRTASQQQPVGLTTKVNRPANAFYGGGAAMLTRLKISLHMVAQAAASSASSTVANHQE